MDVSRELDEVRRNVAGCSLAAFVDIGADMVLSVSADHLPPQEKLDQLGASAKALLDGDLARQAANLLESGVETEAAAVLATLDDSRLFLRSRSRPAEALVLVCEADADLFNARKAGAVALERMSASGDSATDEAS